MIVYLFLRSSKASSNLDAGLPNNSGSASWVWAVVWLMRRSNRARSSGCCGLYSEVIRKITFALCVLDSIFAVYTAGVVPGFLVV